jgi:histidinol phosphatase-like enzyme (inositol monophosphatase family)
MRWIRQAPPDHDERWPYPLPVNDLHTEAQARLTFARTTLAPLARTNTLRWFQSADLHNERKSDGSVVTPVDREVEDQLRAAIAREFPTDGVLGEERGETPARNGARWRWVLDPIDGTGSFVRGLPHWVLLIGIEYESDAVAGLIDCPAIDETVWAARGHGAHWSARGGEPLLARVSSVAEPAAALIEIAPVRSFIRDNMLHVHTRLTAGTKRNRGWSDGYAFALVATGRVDAAINFGFHRWDISACTAILEEAGGRLTDWSGSRDLEAPDVLASNGRLHEHLIELIGVKAGSL